MEISKNWTPEERRKVAFNLTILARNKAAKFPSKAETAHLIFNCLEASAFLLDERISAEFLEANRAQILEHYKE